MSLDRRKDFSLPDDRIWMNCAHQGPLPRVAAQEAREAIDWKSAPHQLSTRRFNEVPERLRSALSRLVGCDDDEIILANSASYGIHLLANGIPLTEGDEVLLVRDDFPSDILPWLGLEKRGIRVRFIEPAHNMPTAEELKAAITPSTRIFCSTWAHSFSGVVIDIEDLGAVCRENDVLFLVNGSQAIGARPIDVSTIPIDALISVGFKWLCGPYGTGFVWIRPELLQMLEYNQQYWLSIMSPRDLGREAREVRLPEGPPTARTYDVFCTANFFNFKPWAASVEYLLEQKIEKIASHGQQLVGTLIEGLDPGKYNLMSPREGDARSTLVFISHRERERNREIYYHLKESGIDISLRREKLRIAPHLYNTMDDISRVLEALNSL
ncbi:MAG: aminotransferase class V-fold PLP-dependent enzyme [bacterium]